MKTLFIYASKTGSVEKCAHYLQTKLNPLVEFIDKQNNDYLDYNEMDHFINQIKKIIS